ncbi:hypothetical protein Leryth_027102, partial [Lithospermum erythrorhizon]
MFSKIGSYLGVPLFADGATSEFAHISYARLYVEVKADKELPDTAPLVWGKPQPTENNVVVQRTKKEWIPMVVEQVEVGQQPVETVIEQDNIVNTIILQAHNPQSVKCSILISNEQYMMGRVKGVGNQGGEFFLSVVYGSNDMGESKE